MLQACIPLASVLLVQWRFRANRQMFHKFASCTLIVVCWDELKSGFITFYIESKETDLWTHIYTSCSSIVVQILNNQQFTQLHCCSCSDMFLHHKWGHCTLFWHNLKYTIMLPQRFKHDAYKSASESAQQIHFLLLIEQYLWKATVDGCLRKSFSLFKNKTIYIWSLSTDLYLYWNQWTLG